MVDAWPSLKILPARPIKESEYADTRCFKRVTDTPTLLHAKTSLPPQGQSWNVRTRLEEVDKAVSKDMRSHHAKAFYDQTWPASCHLSQSRNTHKIPLALTSSSFRPSHHSLQDRDGEGSMRASPAQRGQCPGNTPPHEDSRWRKPFPARPDEKDVRHNQWYVGQYGRQEVEEALTKENKDGTFLVRDCSTKSKAEPYVLVVFYGNKVYNVKIRFLERSQQFALGTGLRGDEKFDSVEDIIAYYKCFPITLIDGKDKTGVHREQCYLTQPLPLPGHFPPG
ncbi:Cytokine-dependent hematopoietic cell linker [Sciurus carolinensis]|uniref:Cytokine-dependent hematopoietic cell linker n=1 Tax=Sciurus carolinensis TaxID=30640 RepID=A0AA41N0A6_SCICA|nr:Cytokine-dependent hematopoietic cell linker [Sciurus carolinensis]